jgi:TatA/E family protein of Tat protein translocase
MLGKVEELLVILVVILVLFGGKKLPTWARSLFKTSDVKTTDAEGKK